MLYSPMELNLNCRCASYEGFGVPWDNDTEPKESECKGVLGRLCRESNSKTEPGHNYELAKQMEGEILWRVKCSKHVGEEKLVE